MENEKFQELVLQTLAQLSEGLKETRLAQVNFSQEQKETRLAQVKFEQELSDKVRALYDAREVQTGINSKVLSALERIEAKVDVLQVETSNIRRVK